VGLGDILTLWDVDIIEVEVSDRVSVIELLEVNDLERVSVIVTLELEDKDVDTLLL
jgi:hypothetical protein